VEGAKGGGKMGDEMKKKGFCGGGEGTAVWGERENEGRNKGEWGSN